MALLGTNRRRGPWSCQGCTSPVLGNAMEGRYEGGGGWRGEHPYRRIGGGWYRGLLSWKQEKE